jgi:hypothetical protein
MGSSSHTRLTRKRGPRWSSGSCESTEQSRGRCWRTLARASWPGARSGQTAAHGRRKTGATARTRRGGEGLLICHVSGCGWERGQIESTDLRRQVLGSDVGGGSVTAVMNPGVPADEPPGSSAISRKRPTASRPRRAPGNRRAGSDEALPRRWCCRRHQTQVARRRGRRFLPGSS